jgi:hypothetical protein
MPMKKVVVALVILAVIITAGVLEHHHIDKTFNTLDEKLYAIENEIHLNSPNALVLTKELSSWWEQQRKHVELFTFSPDIRAFSVALAEQEGSLECGDFDNAMSKCQSLISMSKNIHQILDFNVEDVI